jgi:hypothetical protein
LHILFSRGVFLKKDEDEGASQPTRARGIITQTTQQLLYQDTMMRCVQTMMGCVKTALHAFALGVIPCIAPSLGPHCSQAGITVESLQHPDTITSISPDQLTNGVIMELRKYWSAQAWQGRCSDLLAVWMAKLLPGRCAPNINQLIYSVDRAYDNHINKTKAHRNKCEEFIASRFLCPFCKRPASRQTQIPVHRSVKLKHNVQRLEHNVHSATMAQLITFS